jgi:hypothetical protein
MGAAVGFLHAANRNGGRNHPGLMHINYLSLPILIPFLIVTFVLAVLVRVATFYVERAKHGELKRATGQA